MKFLEFQNDCNSDDYFYFLFHNSIKINNDDKNDHVLSILLIYEWKIL